MKSYLKKSVVALTVGFMSLATLGNVNVNASMDRDGEAGAIKPSQPIISTLIKEVDAELLLKIGKDLSKEATLENGKNVIEEIAGKVLDDLTVSQKAAISPYLEVGKAVYDEVSIDGFKAFINTTSKKINDELDEYKKTTGQEASGLRTFWFGLKHGVIESVKAAVNLCIKIAPTVLPIIIAAL